VHGWIDAFIEFDNCSSRLQICFSKKIDMNVAGRAPRLQHFAPFPLPVVH
jgi:hypothetical protein